MGLSHKQSTACSAAAAEIKERSRQSSFFPPRSILDEDVFPSNIHLLTDVSFGGRIPERLEANVLSFRMDMNVNIVRDVHPTWNARTG